MTGMPLEGHVERSRRAGFAEIMSKPLDLPKFCDKISALSHGGGGNGHGLEDAGGRPAR
jgi:hypothetical protein